MGTPLCEVNMVATPPPRTMSLWEATDTQTWTARQDLMVILVPICMKYQLVSGQTPRVTLSGCWLQILRFLFSGASTDNLPPGVLYKVKATYKYQAEDMDELAFEVGELIQVIEYDDPEEQVCVEFSDESHVTSLRVSGGGLAHGNEGVHRTEGIVPS